MMDTIYTPQHLRMTEQEWWQYHSQLGDYVDDEYIYDVVMAVEHVFYAPNNDGGLDLFTRINEKLRRNGDPHLTHNSLEDLKIRVRSGQLTYSDALRWTWTPNVLRSYGV
jgi:hypothetical protein